LAEPAKMGSHGQETDLLSHYHSRACPLPASLPMSSPTGFGYTEFHHVVD
jgi:hypothetical protein